MVSAVRWERKGEKATNTPYCNTLVAGQGSDPFDGGLAVITPSSRLGKSQKSHLRYFLPQSRPEHGVRNTSIVASELVYLGVLAWKRCWNIHLAKSGLISLSTLCTGAVAARHHSTSDCIRISSSYNLTRQINSILQRRSQNYDDSQSHLGTPSLMPSFFCVPRIPIAEYSVQPIRCSKAMLCCLFKSVML